MANKLDGEIPRKDMTINEDDTTQSANSRCPDSAGYVLVNRLRNGGKDWNHVAIFSTQEEANKLRDILEAKDAKYTYNTKPYSLT